VDHPDVVVVAGDAHGGPCESAEEIVGGDGEDIDGSSHGVLEFFVEFGGGVVVLGGDVVESPFAVVGGGEYFEGGGCGIGPLGHVGGRMVISVVLISLVVIIVVVVAGR